ncbi:MAG: hypothetical protein ACFCD0_19575 [Gemmataceae bacterium]
MNTNNSHEDLHRKADIEMIDSLLRQTMRPDPQAREQRIDRVLTAIDADANQSGKLRSGTSAQPSPKTNWRRWSILTLAATLLLALGLWWLVFSPSQSAYAAVQRSLEQAKMTGARKYRLVAVGKTPVGGHLEREGDLYVDGSEKFAVRVSIGPRLGDLWIGGNADETWVVPPRGPVLVGDKEALRIWVARKKEVSTPYLHITTMLQRMASGYRLKRLPYESIKDLTGAREEILCTRIRGVLRFARKKFVPRKIDLWADRSSGIARRVVLDWEPSESQRGLTRWTAELADKPELPPDWFSHTAHHQGRFVVPFKS